MSNKEQGKYRKEARVLELFLLFLKIMEIEIFTDGAYSPMRDQGGVGLVFVINGKKSYEYNKPISKTTNNKCELLAVIYALKSISKPVDKIKIYTDSQYVIGCATLGWKRKKNVEYWQAYDKAYKYASELCKDIEFIWVKGHENNDSLFSTMNNLADRLAVEASHMVI